MAQVKLPTWVAYTYVALLSLSYVMVRVHTPIQIELGPHDGGLYMQLGRSLAEGNWLGTYNEYTLMKGPGYAAFLALGHWLGISVSLAHALFHCAAIIVFVLAIRWLVRSLLLSCALLTMLIWDPIPMTSDMLRVYRDVIYYAQLLLVLGTVVWMIFCTKTFERTLAAAIVAGISLGWFWLSREEGVWIIPALLVLIVGGTTVASRERRVRKFVLGLFTFLLTFVIIQVGFRAANWVEYGSFVGVDVKEANFQRALAALHSIRSGGTRPFVSMTRAARERAKAVSPAFASLSGYLDGPPGEAWAKLTCNASPRSCGDIGSGWFMFVLRHAASSAGHFSDPAKASAFFGELADEISAACDDGRLECSAQLTPEMPPFHWQHVVEELPRDTLRLMELLFVYSRFEAQPSTGTHEELITNLRFLNYPEHSPSKDIPDASAIFQISGWYYRSGADWVSMQVGDGDGSWGGLSYTRKDSPDIQKAFSDAAATHQRFVIRTACSPKCVLQFRGPDGSEAQRSLADLGRAPLEIELGTGRVFIDSTDAEPNAGYELYPPEPSDTLSAAMRTLVLTNYNLILFPMLAAGICAFVANILFYGRFVFHNACCILAVASWLLVIVRGGLIILIDATSFPALHLTYLAPAHFMLVCAALLSCAAWLQLREKHLATSSFPPSAFTPSKGQIVSCSIDVRRGDIRV